jgi:hypothetical protein
MKDVESRLKELRLAKPSVQLDRRMDQLFASAPPAPRPGFFRKPVPLWLCVSACLVFAAGGFLLRPHAGQAPVSAVWPGQVVQIIYSNRPASRSVFDWTQCRDPFWDVGAKRKVVVMPGSLGGGQASGDVT